MLRTTTATALSLPEGEAVSTDSERRYAERPSRPGHSRLDALGALIHDVRLVCTDDRKWRLEYRCAGREGRYHVRKHDGGERRWARAETALRVAEAAGIRELNVRF